MSASPFVILYVEDDELTRETFAELLATDGRQVVGVSDGAGARQALREQKVSLLITDLNLPDGSGVDVAREALVQNPQLPVIICSGYDSTAEVQSLGPTAHSLKKPIQITELEAVVERLAK